MRKLQITKFEQQFDHNKYLQTRQLKSQDFMNRQGFQTQDVNKLKKREI